MKVTSAYSSESFPSSGVECSVDVWVDACKDHEMLRVLSEPTDEAFTACMTCLHVALIGHVVSHQIDCTCQVSMTLCWSVAKPWSRMKSSACSMYVRIR